MKIDHIPELDRDGRRERVVGIDVRIVFVFIFEARATATFLEEL